MKITKQNLSKAHITSTITQLHVHHHSDNLKQTKQNHVQIIKTHVNHQSYFNILTHYNLLISSYIRNNQPLTALKVYACMRQNSLKIDSFTAPTVLKACSLAQKPRLGKELHGYAVKNGLDSDVFVSNALIKMYGELGCMSSSRFVFDEMSSRDAVSWSSMIGCFCKSGMFDEALRIWREMWFCRVRPGVVAMLTMVGLFGDVGDVDAGKAIHGCAIKNSLSEKMGVVLGTSLIDMYVKCGDLGSARQIFDDLDERSDISWTAMIAGCIRCNRLREGARLLVEMLGEDLFPSDVTIRSLVIECGFVGGLEFGKFLHCYVLRNGVELSVDTTNALVDMYGKCGDIRCARSLFHSLKSKGVMTWSVMISAYAQARCNDRAFELFILMKGSQVNPNEVIMVTLLSLCAKAGDLDVGKWIHTYEVKQGMETDMLLKTALMDMYAKCGDIDSGYRLFNEAKVRDICLWNAMLVGYGMNGHCREALELFADIERSGLKPNDITFIALLNACSHAGSVAEGRMVFKKMIDCFGLVPKMEHYGCMVDLLGRAGLLDEAFQFIKNMLVMPNSIVWGALLAASTLHKNPNIGEVAAKELLDMEPESRGYNVLMSNVYAAANRWIDVARVRRTMTDIGVRKEPGLSSVK